MTADPVIDPDQVQVCAEPGCDRTDIVARGLCTMSYKRWRRGRLGLPDSPLLPPIQAAYARVLTLEQPIGPAMDELRTSVRLAYGAGLSTYQIGDATGRAPYGIWRWLDPDQRRHRGSVGRGRSATPELVARWTPILAERAARVDEVNEGAAEARKTLVELARDATRDDRDDRVGVHEIGKALGVRHQTVDEWLHPEAKAAQRRGRLPKRQCVGRRLDGGACGSRPRRGFQTCFHHRDQDPGG